MYVDNSGIEHEDYEAACRYYGADSPAVFAAEAKADQEDLWIMTQDHVETCGPTPFAFGKQWNYDDIPF